ncbi:hypothetical protein [Candidatus Uabimicrobium sp. HlEnr_7]|uniref:hypothetical protein n=1 Tax=Candidatus Uabimicrobium helgolandensis TaxID=3095367 RepID=UPI003557BD89
MEILIGIVWSWASTENGRRNLCLVVAFFCYLFAFMVFQVFISTEKTREVTFQEFMQKDSLTKIYLVDFKIKTSRVLVIRGAYYVPIISKNTFQKSDKILLLKLEKRASIGHFAKSNKIYIQCFLRDLSKLYPKLKNKKVYVAILAREPVTIVPILILLFIGILFTMMAFPSIFITPLIEIKNPARENVRKKRLEKMRLRKASGNKLRRKEG